MNNPTYINMSDKELIAHIAQQANELMFFRSDISRMVELREATTELDLRVNRS
jgi:hypothetical protein